MTLTFEEALETVRYAHANDTPDSRADLFLAAFEQIEANRKAIEELRAEYDVHLHKFNGPPSQPIRL